MKNLQIIGNLGMDATINEDNGKKQVRFSVGVSEKYKDSSGNQVERTDWISVFYNGLGLAPYLKKGTKVFVAGNMNTRMYQDREKTWRVGISINATNIQLLSAKKEEEQNTSSGAMPTLPEAQNAAVPAGEMPNDDLPF